MHSIAPILGVLLSTFAHSAVAGWFGPSTYEDCVLDALKATKSAAGVEAVKQACWEKFKPKNEQPAFTYIPLTAAQLGGLSSQYKNVAIWTGGGPIDFRAVNGYPPDTNLVLTVYNGNETFAVSRVTIDVTTAAPGQPGVSRRYVGDGLAGSLSVGDFYFRIQSPCDKYCMVRVVGANWVKWNVK